MQQVHEGMEVYSYNLRIGVVEGIVPGDTADRPALLIRRDGGPLQLAAAGTYDVADGAVRIDEPLLRDVVDGTAGPQTAALDAQVAGARAAAQPLQQSDELRIPVIEEQAVVRVREVERGGVRVHKRVHEREEVVEQPTFHEEVDVERVPIGQFVDHIPQPREEGDTLIVPILEEVLVVEKRLVVKEELRITRRRSEETQRVNVTLRSEEAIVERIDERESGA